MDKRLAQQQVHRRRRVHASPTSPSSRGCARWKNQGIDWTDYPHLKGWFDEIAARPAVQRGVEVLAALRKPMRTEQAREVLFGATQYQRR